MVCRLQVCTLLESFPLGKLCDLAIWDLRHSMQVTDVVKRLIYLRLCFMKNFFIICPVVVTYQYISIQIFLIFAEYFKHDTIVKCC